MDVSESQIQALRKFVATDAGARVVLALVLGRPQREISEEMRGYIDGLTTEQRLWELTPNA